MNELSLFFGICAAAMIGVIVVAVVVKMRQVRGAQSWRSTTGKIIRSSVRATKTRDEGRERIRNQPAIAYEYSVDGQRHTGDRISFGAIIADSDIESTLERYPVGAQVNVYYDPSNPKQSVLERDLPENFGRGLATVFVLFGGGAVLLLLILANVPALLSPYLGNPQNATFVTLSAGMGILMLVFGVVQKRQEFAMRAWSSTRGTVTLSEVRSFTQWKDNREHTYYVPGIVYEYSVEDRKYTSDRFYWGTEISWGDPRRVEMKITQYPVGKEVTVYYNPAAPAESVLDRRITIGWTIWAMGIGLVALAVNSAGIF